VFYSIRIFAKPVNPASNWCASPSRILNSGNPPHRIIWYGFCSRFIRSSKMKSFIKKNKRSIIMIASVLLLSGGVTAYLIGFSAEVEKPEEEKNLRLVETIPLRYSPHTMKVQGQGFIEPSHSLELASQAGGQVIESYQNLKSGIAVEKGTLLIQLDDELIINRLALSRVELISTTTKLVTAIKSEGGSFYNKWMLYLRSLSTELSLTPRIPDLTSEREKLLVSSYGVLAAYYQVRELEDTHSDYTIYAPFSGHISGDGIEKYSFVSPGQSLLTLSDTTHLEIAIPLTREELIRLDEIESEVLISPSGVDNGFLSGKVERRDAVMDRNSQTINLHIIFENPELNPLFLPGNYAKVEISGKTLARTLLLPRSLINADNTINVYEEGKLKKYKVTILSIQGDKVILKPELPEGIQIITTRIQKPFEGMELKLEGSEE
jgi:multidrug efflux pump subunit AcrA (membrane-fusion protein)